MYLTSPRRPTDTGLQLGKASHLTSPGRPTDIGLQLGKACYPCSR